MDGRGWGKTIALIEKPERNLPATLMENFPPSEKHRGMELKSREQRGGKYANIMCVTSITLGKEESRLSFESEGWGSGGRKNSP